MRAPRGLPAIVLAAALLTIPSCTRHTDPPAPPARTAPDRPVLVLVHSPLVGPFSWSPVAEVLRRRGETVLVPDLGPGLLP